jgi:hypothetical protein
MIPTVPLSGLALRRFSCYNVSMSNILDNRQPTTLIPVTTMEEVAVLSADQRTALLASLADAEREITEGRGALYDSEELRRHFMQGFESRKTSAITA